MINKDIYQLKKYCKDYKNIENYTEALSSPLRYDLHHRLEISEMQSASDLKFLHLYYHRPPEELIFLEHGEHMRLHNAGKHPSTETRQRMSNAKKNMSEETKRKMSDAKKGEKSYMYGKPKSAETRQKISEAKKGLHWHLENGHRICTD